MRSSRRLALGAEALRAGGGVGKLRVAMATIRTTARGERETAECNARGARSDSEQYHAIG